MKIVRRACPDPTGHDLKDHHHWSIYTKTGRISWGLWFDYDHRNFGCPCEVIVARAKTSMIYTYRPFVRKNRLIKRSMFKPEVEMEAWLQENQE